MRTDRTSRRTPRASTALALAATLSGALAAEDGWAPVTPDHAWSFPRDHHAHEETSIEWWYVTGIVEDVDEPGRRYGYQFTLFRVGLVPGAPAPAGGFDAGHAVMGHASITDVEGGDHRFLELFRRASPLLGGFGAPGDDAALAWARAPAGTDDRWEIARRGSGFEVRARDDARGAGFELLLEPRRPPVFQGPNGYSAKSPDGAAASLYYSFTRLATGGTMTLDGRTFRVEGESWMDREWSSSQLSDRQVGWDWFALRLDDGRDLMLYLLRRADGTVDHARGTLVSADGTVEWLDAGAWTLDATATWTSPATGATYPSSWRLALPAAKLEATIRPLLDDQENVSAILDGLRYWEGAVSVERGGARIGEGYVELTGYGDGARLPL